jgi:hypothetical protein
MQLDPVLSMWITNVCHVKVIQPRCVTNQYLFYDNSHTQHYSIINQAYYLEKSNDSFSF